MTVEDKAPLRIVEQKVVIDSAKQSGHARAPGLQLAVQLCPNPDCRDNTFIRGANMGYLPVIILRS